MGCGGLKEFGPDSKHRGKPGEVLEQSKDRIGFTLSQDYSSCCVERGERTGQRKDRKQKDPLPLYCNRWRERRGWPGLRVRVRRHGGL